MGKTKTIEDVDLCGKKVFLRVDFNVPIDGQGRITDDSRIQAALPTIRHLVSQGARVILASHLGRPKGEPKPEFSLQPVARALAGLLEKEVLFSADCIGEDAVGMVADLPEGGLLLLENLRFHAGEEKNDPAFAEALAQLADAYVNDAFGSAHRAHASTEGITRFLSPCLAGFLMEKELAYLGDQTENPQRPFVVILGGAKVSDKIRVIDTLLEKADVMLIGGAMAYTFALAEGRGIGKSLSEPDKVETALQAIEKAKAKGVRLLLPLDNIAVQELDFKAGKVGETRTFEGTIEDGWEGVDIGPKTIAAFQAEITNAGTVLWNGPMGIFEIEACNRGTFAIAEAVAESGATSIIGGGDSVTAIKQSGFAEQVSFMSTGGGASLEFLEGKTLPGVAALDRHA